MFKQYLLVTNPGGSYWWNNEEELLNHREACINVGHQIEFCGKVNVEMVYSNDNRNKLVYV